MLCYHLTQRGLFSELNCLLNAYFYALRHGHEFRVEDEGSNLYFSEGFESYFMPFCKSDQQAQNEILVRGFSRGACGKATGRIFKLIQLYAAEHLSFEAKRVVCRSLAFNRRTTIEISEKIESFKLPGSYSGMMIRWGDKVGDLPAGKHPEATKCLVERYVEKLPRDINDVFLMTDDYRAYQEVQGYIDRKGLPFTVHTQTLPTELGHCTSHRINQRAWFTRDEVVRLLAEIELLSRSEYLVATLSSNMARYVKLRHKNPENCISLDTQWHPG